MPADEQTCGHEYVPGGVAYGCERAPHPVNGYRPASGIDAEFAEGTDEGDGHGPATLVTWAEDIKGSGQDWGIAWGTAPLRCEFRSGSVADGHGTPRSSRS